MCIFLAVFTPFPPESRVPVVPLVPPATTFLCPNTSTSSTTCTTCFEEKRKILLDSYRKKQPFRVSIGKTTWIPYEQFNPDYNLREILKDEIVIEFDSKDFKGSIEELQKKISYPAAHLTGVNLYKAGYIFEIWEHGGKSPHLHIHNLPILNLEANKRALFKKLFIRKYVPLDYLKWVDISLTGIHLIAIEWQNHWKGCYEVKKLLSEFNPKEDL